MIIRMWVLGGLAWVVVVIIGSAFTWVAINHAGQQVTGSSAFSNVTPPPPRPSHRESPSSTPAPTRTSVARHTPVPSPNALPTNQTPPTSAAPKPEFGTWSGTAGSVTASCVGRTARLVGAWPNDGWHVGNADPSGTSIEITFSKTATQVQVQATCVTDAPVFQVDTSGAADS